MSFIVDKQTLEDLNVLGKYKQQSIFSLFNKVKTAGGEQLLQTMFQFPLTDPETINKRSHIFKYFHSNPIVFPFGSEQFDVMENYLSGTGEKNYAATLLSLTRKKIQAAIVRDEDYANLQSGLQLTIALLNNCKTFINRLVQDGEKAKQSHPFYDELLTVKNMLNDRKLDWLKGEQTSATPLTLQKFARYHHLLRHTMKSALKTVVEIFYQLDVYITIADIAKIKGFSYAIALPKEDNCFLASGLRHPNIDKAVTNPVSFNQHSNMIFLTGANMAGKSTFMKTFGVNVYLAHMGFPVAANDMKFSVKQGIYSSINVPDSLEMGYSHFYAEVLRVKKVAEEVSMGKDLVIIFDELFKGTNVKDAYDATLAITAAFSEYRNCLFIISTHIIEAGEALRHHNNLQALYLPTIMNGTIPTYTYQLQPGISSDRHGMMIIENEGILEMLEKDNDLIN
ncbi:DNA mismatch repair protein [Pedobacter sp. L105]|uniref:MutS-related protein n=1 Tax=Pedobacter sp. L105 TaxID=1641871 RepID=UPI00131ACC37|nr:DNA mismatch repair protein [Pedobacter sp. L105]